MDDLLHLIQAAHFIFNLHFCYFYRIYTSFVRYSLFFHSSFALAWFCAGKRYHFNQENYPFVISMKWGWTVNKLKKWKAGLDNDCFIAAICHVNICQYGSVSKVLDCSSKYSFSVHLGLNWCIRLDVLVHSRVSQFSFSFSISFRLNFANTHTQTH